MNQVLIVIKKTKYELDEEIYPDRDFYERITKIQNNSFDKIYQSHLRQLKSREYLQKYVFPKGKYIFREELDTISMDDFDLVVSLGGDNHFTYVAHHLNGTAILGCNSDSMTSKGALLDFTPETLKELVDQNWENHTEEYWSLIQAKITYPDNSIVSTVKCVNEISIRNASPDLTSRYILNHNGVIEEQKSSGLLLYTGAGSTGWYTSCTGLSLQESPVFPKDADYFGVFSRELSVRARANFKLTDFRVDGTLKVISEMNGGISIDSLPERIYPFPPGSIAEFTLSPKNLKVITSKITKKEEL